MSRDSNGTHTLPTGNPVVSGSAISSTVHNATLTDLSTEITDSLSRSGKGGMSAALDMGGNKITGLGDGTKTAPAVTFSSDPDTGIYRIGSNNIGVSVGDTKILDVGTAGLDVVGKMAATGAVSGTTAAFSGAGSFGGALDMNSQKITELAVGTAATDAVALSQITPVAATYVAGTDWNITGATSKKVLGVVTINALATAGATSAFTSVLTMDVGFRPATRIVVPLYTYDLAPGTAAIGSGSLETTGVLSVSTSFTIATGDFVWIAFSYVTA